MCTRVLCNKRGSGPLQLASLHHTRSHSTQDRPRIRRATHDTQDKHDRHARHTPTCHRRNHSTHPPMHSSLLPARGSPTYIHGLGSLIHELLHLRARLLIKLRDVHLVVLGGHFQQGLGLLVHGSRRTRHARDSIHTDRRIRWHCAYGNVGVRGRVRRGSMSVCVCG